MKKSLTLKLLLVTIATSSLIATIPLISTSCGKTTSDVVGSLDGKNWDGYANDGSSFTPSDYRINEQDKTVTYTYNDSKQYSAQNLIIPNKILVNKHKYQLIIGDYAFSSINITGSVTISNGIPSIGYQAFYDCSGLTGSLTIPSFVTYIGADAFYNTNFTRDENHTLYSADKKWCIGYINAGGSETKPSGTLSIPDTVTFIANSAFSECSDLTGSLLIPNSITSIGDGAFANCSSFSGSLIIPTSVTSIGSVAFYGCFGFSNTLSIPSSVTHIGNFTFSNCYGFSGTLMLPHYLTYIGNQAFSGCYGFSGLAIPDSVISIEDQCFQNCSGLTGILTIPDSVTYVGIDAFTNTNFTRDGNHTLYSSNNKWCIGYINSGGSETKPSGALTFPSSLTHICSGAFSGCSSLTGTLSIPNAVTFIGDGSFYGCSGLTGTLTIPDSVTFIGNNTFLQTSLSRDGNHTLYSSNNKWCIGYINVGGSETQPSGTLTFPNTVTSICGSAFSFCSNLTEPLTFPSTITSIGVRAFDFCSDLPSIEFSSTTPPSIGSEAFDMLDYSGAVHQIYIPHGTTTAYTIALSGSGIPNDTWVISERD